MEQRSTPLRLSQNTRPVVRDIANPNSFTKLPVRFKTKILKICLVIFCLLRSSYALGSPEFDGATFFMRRLDITNQKYGKLTAITFSHSKSGQSFWNCQCDCGSSIVVYLGHLRSGHTVSCGCIRLDFPHRRTHGESHNNRTPEHRSWTDMLSRCRNVKRKCFNDYGGRGITVCERWLKYENFLADMGRKPTLQHSLDRRDNNKGYYLENCRWATSQEQAYNRRSNVILEYNGVKMNLKKWAEYLKIDVRTLWQRKKRGWSVVDILTKPLR